MKLLPIVALPLLAMALFVGVTQIKAATCDPTQLVSCLDPIVKGTTPSSKCCSKLKEQKACLCRYIKDPNFGKYVNSPGAKKVTAICRVPYPKCKS
ncbi:Bifunctional inhibitor/plant lipid transfer protein/seed storage helical domain-containing protein [Cynara cardunculus var. scolymus]|uniref:Bifunctional inhibitor/plant lipid transfer protein/seed storage helical domain-containing protein n=1 Tax=Cynara cardunculus var. scolymus TaxID=59895 RepID=A0A118K5B8_CYNCS|nr:Bifunctional inhibitor/plant lipid transfer protein/seed storage helical domain-containing protein [Cynara cardunculus var. scolymus]